MRSAPSVALVCPTAWDRAQLRRRGSELRIDATIVWYGADAEADPASFDVTAFLDTAVQDLRAAGVAGVTSSSDYPGCLLAAELARRLGLPGPDPVSLLRASHKYYSRIRQEAAVPAAVPHYWLIDPDNLVESARTLEYPVFVKPVKSWFSQHATKISSYSELVAMATSAAVADHLSHFVLPFNELLETYPEFVANASYLIAEEVLEGQQVTLEGYVLCGNAVTLGIVDSIMHEGTNSFQWFVYPSRLDSSVTARMSAIAHDVMAALGFTHGLFNVEFMYHPTSGAIHVIEVNPRMCGQFADLFQNVDGVSTYEVLFYVALGLRPAIPPRRKRAKLSSSYAARSFGDGLAISMPSARRVGLVKCLTSVTLFLVYYTPGQRLSARAKQFDGASYRYAVVNVHGPDFSSVQRRSIRALRVGGVVVAPDNPC